jgi:aspartyl-tRNA(Asn)/glutamyl-tRNA(Gln) amidotransferase subunit A
MQATELSALTLAEAADGIRERTISPVALVETLLDRIARLNPVLNAYVTVLGDLAVDEARQAEAEIVAGGYRGPLHGIPVSLKDLIYTAGVRTTAGSRILRDFVPDHDATVATRLREAGAIVIAKANMLEFAYGEIHPDYGPSCNPHNPAYGTSGSSSGSGASVAAGLDFGSLGSDTGGSIRCPAAFCGIVGLKPTYGLVSRHGVVPLSWTLDHVGPMTRTARDAAIMLQVIAGYDAADPGSAQVKVPDYQSLIGAAPQSPKIGVVELEGDDAVNDDVRRETDNAVRALVDAGYTAVPVKQPHPIQAARVMLALVYIEASTFHRSWLETRRDEYSQNTLDRLELGTMLPGALYVRAQRARRVVAAAYRELFADVDFLAMPVVPEASYRLEDAPPDPVLETGDRLLALSRFSAPFNVTGLPAISVPCGFADDGLPIGLQLVGRPFAEPELFQIADILERQIGRFGRPVDASLTA